MSWLIRSRRSADVSLSKYTDRPLLLSIRSCCLLSPRLSSLSYTHQTSLKTLSHSRRLSTTPSAVECRPTFKMYSRPRSDFTSKTMLTNQQHFLKTMQNWRDCWTLGNVRLLHINILHCRTRKPSWRWQTRATRKHAENCSNSTCLQRYRWQYWSIFTRLAVVASEICEIPRNSLKIQTYRVKVIQGHQSWCQSKADMYFPISH